LKHHPDIAVLWRQPDGTECRLTRRNTELWVELTIEGRLVREHPVVSPREAMEISDAWRKELKR
jgi:hypothetical protein